MTDRRIACLTCCGETRARVSFPWQVELPLATR